MKVWAFTLVYNEAVLIKYWLRHYLSFCEKAFVFVDTDTDDNTAEIAHLAGAEVYAYEGHGQGMNDFMMASFCSREYKLAIGQADWVIWTDADEIIYHTDIQRKLEQLLEDGINLPLVEGYTMASDAPPSHAGQIYDDPRFRKGLYNCVNPKLSVFNPNQLDLEWNAGRHTARIHGDIREGGQEDPLKLLHYRWLGEQWLYRRDAKNYARLGDGPKALGLGYHVYPEFIGPYHHGWSGLKPSDATDVI